MAIPEKHKRFCFRNNRSIAYCYFKYTTGLWAIKHKSGACTIYFNKTENDFIKVLSKMNSEAVYTLNIEGAMLYEFNEKEFQNFFM